MSDARDVTASEQALRAVRGGMVGRRAQSLALNVVLYAVAIAGALAVSALLIVIATDSSPWSVFREMYEGSLGSGAALGLSIDEATPILIVALGAVIAGRAGIINIGPEGQLIIGGLCGAWIALKVPGPGPLLIVLTLAGAALGGALWAGVAALLRFSRGVDIVISTLLLNFIAEEVLSFSVNRAYLLRETTDNPQSLPQSDRIPSDTHFPRLGEFPGFNVSTGVFLALAALVIVTVALRRSRWGFRMRMLGLNPRASRRAGISVVALGTGALLLSGGFAGLAGGTMLTGTVFRIQPGFSSSVGFNGLLVALIARGNALWCIPVAFFFGALQAGGGLLAATGVPRYLVNVVQALLVLAALFPPVFIELRERRRQISRARAAAREERRPEPAAVPA
ncbi:MAG TPA: ABC transporter permease [Acidimicrobiales bacterium]|jgi:simple sugar transport system permease protein|nr:ABC transporter permease [Acidimicrobiales bacterium]